MIHPAACDLDTLGARAISQTLGPALAAYQYHGAPRIYWRRVVQGAAMIISSMSVMFRARHCQPPKRPGRSGIL
ncbi:MAG: hypothetical protein MI924_10725 [Chloroflexales bacterium]|nr:hypothetical protein [Chloroflexales bacterium]